MLKAELEKTNLLTWLFIPYPKIGFLEIKSIAELNALNLSKSFVWIRSRFKYVKIVNKIFSKYSTKNLLLKTINEKVVIASDNL